MPRTYAPIEMPLPSGAEARQSWENVWREPAPGEERLPFFPKLDFSQLLSAILQSANLLASPGTEFANPVALTKPQWIEGVRAILKEANPNLLRRVSKGVLKSIDEVIPLTEETVSPKWYTPEARGMMVSKRVPSLSLDRPSETAEKTIVALSPTEARGSTPLHEAGHELYFMLPKEEQALAKKAYNSLKIGDLRNMEEALGVSLHNQRELFAATYAAYLGEDYRFSSMPPFFKHLVKKYHRLTK
jgi:hypothetical protein